MGQAVDSVGEGAATPLARNFRCGCMLQVQAFIFHAEVGQPRRNTACESAAEDRIVRVYENVVAGCHGAEPIAPFPDQCTGIDPLVQFVFVEVVQHHRVWTAHLDRPAQHSGFKTEYAVICLNHAATVRGLD